MWPLGSEGMPAAGARRPGNSMRGVRRGSRLPVARHLPDRGSTSWLRSSENPHAGRRRGRPLPAYPGGVFSLLCEHQGSRIVRLAGRLGHETVARLWRMAVWLLPSSRPCLHHLGAGCGAVGLRQTAPGVGPGGSPVGTAAGSAGALRAAPAGVWPRWLLPGTALRRRAVPGAPNPARSNASLIAASRTAGDWALSSVSASRWPISRSTLPSRRRSAAARAHSRALQRLWSAYGGHDLGSLAAERSHVCCARTDN